MQMMKDAERRRLVDLRHALLDLHKTLLDWERAAYERAHGRSSAAELLKIVVENPQFAWLRPVSEVIVRIDEALETETPDSPIDVDALASRVRVVVAPDEAGTPYAQRYYAALQEHPDAVLAHRAVTKLLKDVPSRDTLH
jgi:hypothetical protein